MLPVTGTGITPLVLMAITLIAIGALVSWRWRAGRALYAVAALAAVGALATLPAPAAAANDDCPPVTTAAPTAPTPTPPATTAPNGSPTTAAPDSSAPTSTAAPTTTAAEITRTTDAETTTTTDAETTTTTDAETTTTTDAPAPAGICTRERNGANVPVGDRFLDPGTGIATRYFSNDGSCSGAFAGDYEGVFTTGDCASGTKTFWNDYWNLDPQVPVGWYFCFNPG